jgi:uncharacterized membrane protein
MTTAYCLRRNTARVPSLSVTHSVAAPLYVVEAAWYDTGRWPQWVVGLERVVEVQDGWPDRPGATVTWCSNPAGRGTVHEQVLDHTPGAGQRVSVSDDLIQGEQSVAFAPAGPAAVEVSLTLTFMRRRGGLFTAIVDVMFSRRAVTDALAHTLERFAAAVEPRS